MILVRIERSRHPNDKSHFRSLLFIKAFFLIIFLKIGDRVEYPFVIQMEQDVGTYLHRLFDLSGKGILACQLLTDIVEQAPVVDGTAIREVVRHPFILNGIEAADIIHRIGHSS